MTLLGDTGLVVSPIGVGLAAVGRPAYITLGLEQPFVDVVLSGAATTAQLASHLGASTVRLDDEARALLPRLAEAPERYWATRARLPWS